MTFARVLGAIGRSLITIGTLMLLFVAYQLWGTGIREAQAQNRLENAWEAVIGGAASSTVTSTTSASTSTTDPATSTSVDPNATTTTATLPVQVAGAMDVIPPEGDVAGHIVIPKIGVDKYVVQGVALTDLKKGPGHYPATPFPGQAGNAAIAGHRTTYGAPFGNIDQLAAGDEILIDTVQGHFRYVVSDTEGDGNGNLVVAPNATEVLENQGDNRLTLTACHPKYSARQRIVVVAMLEGQPAPPPPPEAIAQQQQQHSESDAFTEGLSGGKAPKLPAILLGLACALVWFGAWLVGRRWRKWPSYVIGFPIFMVLLFFFFENFARLLPSNY